MPNRIVTVQRAPRLDSYPALPVRGEASILPVVAAVRCACGGVLRQLAGDDIRSVVTAHNATAGHAAWREARG